MGPSSVCTHTTTNQAVDPQQSLSDSPLILSILNEENTVKFDWTKRSYSSNFIDF